MTSLNMAAAVAQARATQTCPKCKNQQGWCTGELPNGDFCNCHWGQIERCLRQKWLAEVKAAEEAARQRRLEKAWGPLEIPPEFRGLGRLKDVFGDKIYEGKVEAVQAAQDFIAGKLNPPLLLLHGPYRTGKTALAAQIARRLGYGIFETLTGFFTKLQGVSLEEKAVLLATAKECPLLVIDDFGNPLPDPGKRLTQWRREILQDILGHRLEHHEPTILTSNLTGDYDEIEDQFVAQFDRRLWTRLRRFHIVEMAGADLDVAPKRGRK